MSQFCLGVVSCQQALVAKSITAANTDMYRLGWRRTQFLAEDFKKKGYKLSDNVNSGDSEKDKGSAAVAVAHACAKSIP